jgi:hypothetical protein
MITLKSIENYEKKTGKGSLGVRWKEDRDLMSLQ